MPQTSYTLRLRSLARNAAVVAVGVWLGIAVLLPSASAQTPLDQVAAASPEVLARNKRNVIEFYDLAFNKSKPREAVERYVGDTYIQHNPEVPDGKDGFIWYFEKMARDYPDKKLSMRRVFAEGNHVIVHCWSRFPALLGATDFMAIDIFRIDDNGKIVEHWDVLQRIPRSSTNRNPMY